jgi:multidrug efflux pump subunit AcrB
VQGVAQVALGGEQRPAIRVQVDPAKLASRGLTLEEVRNALATATTDAPKGALTTQSKSFTIEANDQIIEAKQFDDVIIAYRNGAPVRVRDVGRAIAAATDRFSAAYHDNALAIILSVYKQPGANVIDTVERIKELLPKLKTVIPPAVKIDTVLDRTGTIRASVHDVEFTMVLTIVLVVLVVLLFLRNTWATLVPAFTIVLSLLASFAAMYLFNFSINNLTLMALTIAIGFVVDDAIVEVENVHRHIEGGAPPFKAALNGSGEIRFTVLSISLSLMVVFIGGDPRQAVPGIRRDRHGGRRGVGLRIVDSGPDAVLALSAPPSTRARQAISCDRSWLRRYAGVLPAHPRYRTAAPSHHTFRILRHLGVDDRLGISNPQGLLSDPGYRNDSGPCGGRAGRLAH